MDLKFLLLVSSIIVVGCRSNPEKTQQSSAVKIILDTDFGNDCDDTGALAILHQMAYNGEAEILATMYPMNDSMGAAAIDAVNTYYGKPNIPVGTYKGTYTYKGPHNDFYNTRLLTGFDNDLRSGTNAPDAVGLYREILNDQPDGSVIIVVVGPQRLIADLLLSPADSISALTGKELIAKKVKRLVSMGTEAPKGDEWNIKICPDAAQVVAREWPTPVTYSGFEIGHAIMTGERLMTEAKESPVKVAFETNPMVDSVKNRHSWDQTAVLCAVRGPDQYWDLQEGQVEIADDGKNQWTDKENTNRFYLKVKTPPAEMKKIIEDMMVAPPRK